MKWSLVVAPLVLLVATIAAVVATSTLVLRLPGIPYNIGELFLSHGSLSALVFFALTTLWVGAGAMVVAHLLCRSRRAYLILPLALVVVSLISKMLLTRSVTYESIDDIIGSNNLFGLVTGETVWGAAGRQAFQRLGPDVVDFVERRVRYIALYSIPLLGIALPLASAARSVRSVSPMKLLGKFLLVVGVAGWFWLARAIVVTWAATDNLTELIARRSPLGIAGEWYLFAIPVLIGLCVALLIRATEEPTWWPAAIASTVVAVPVGWVLLKLGLEGHVEKYGSVFSGAQFLLGPDRRHTLTETALFARWAALQTGGVGVTFIGAWIAHRLAGITLRCWGAVDAASSRRRDRRARV